MLLAKRCRWLIVDLDSDLQRSVLDGRCWGRSVWGLLSPVAEPADWTEAGDILRMPVGVVLRYRILNVLDSDGA